MKKKLIIINGPSGAGKSTACDLLYRKIDKSVWLDGDWCWLMNPWNFCDENKRMVENNISFILNSYLKNKNINCIIFSWVIPQEDIFDLILKKLDKNKCEVVKISLICSKKEIERRNKNKSKVCINRSNVNLGNYKKMNTFKINTTNKKPKEVVDSVLNIIG